MVASIEKSSLCSECFDACLHWLLTRLDSAMSFTMISQLCKTFSPNRNFSNSKIRNCKINCNGGSMVPLSRFRNQGFAATCLTACFCTHLQRALGFHKYSPAYSRHFL